MSRDLGFGLTEEHVRESNLIEGFRNPTMDACTETAWAWLLGRDAGGDLEETLHTLHRVITASQFDPRWAANMELTGGWRGRFRQVDLQVGGRECPPWQEVPGLMAEFGEEWSRWAQRDPRELHVQYEVVHPYADGNGRTGRLLMWWHEVLLGRTPTLIRYSEVQRYYDWFRGAG